MLLKCNPPARPRTIFHQLLSSLQSFVANPASTSTNQPLLSKTAPIDYSDPLLELLPEVYLDGPEPSSGEITEAVARMVRDHAAFLVKFGKEGETGQYK